MKVKIKSDISEACCNRDWVTVPSIGDEVIWLTDTNMMCRGKIVARLFNYATAQYATNRENVTLKIEDTQPVFNIE